MKLTDEQKRIAEELFNMVYQWGRVGVVVDCTSPVYIKTVQELLETVQNKTKTTQNTIKTDEDRKK